MEYIDMLTKMMAGSLGLEEPWYTSGVEFGEKELALHRYEPRERVWRHGDVMFYPCLVHCRRSKVLCPKCGSVQVSAPLKTAGLLFCSRATPC